MVVATTIGVSIVGRLLGAGIQRSGSLLFQKILRLGRIEAALKGVSKNSLVESAVHDFETIIGTYYGELNVELETFVRELERSGIINLMVESALLKRDVLSNQMLFTDLHERIINSGGNAEALFQRMMKSFTVTLEELCKDKILLEAVRLHRAELSSRIDRVDGMLSDLSKFLKKDKESLEDTQQTLLKIAKGLQSQYRTVRVETNKGPRSVEISRIYIPPKLSYRESQNSANRIASVLPLIARIPKAAPKAVQHDFASEQEERDGLTRVTYGDLRLSFSRVVVLGDPGGGKSTLCQFLCHDLTKQALASVQIEGGRQLNAQLQKFPIRVILRSFEKARTLQPQLGLFQYILRDLKNYVTAEDKELSAALLFLLSTGSAVLAFDGLDEILATAQRREFVDLVKAFCDQFPLCPVLVTSRLVGYDDANLSEEFEEFILGKFDDQEVQSYATKFLKVVGSHKERDAERRAQLFFKQTTSNAADLRRNPLLLGLMAWLFHMRGDVPSNRPEIYRECAILMFEKWDPDRDINADIPKGFDRLQLFSNLASKIFGHPELSAGVESQWLQKEIQEYFQNLYENKAQSFEAAKALVTFITGRAWVMSEMGDKVFAFTHQTFLEYFFALHIDEMHDSVKEVLNQVLPKVSRGEWDMVSHLSLQIKTYRNLRRQNEAIELLVENLENEKSEKKSAAIASFAARALEYLAASESQIKQLVVELVRRALSGPESKRYQLWKDVAQSTQSGLDRKEFIEKLIIALLVKEFKSGDEETARNIEQAIAPSDGLIFDSKSRYQSILSAKLTASIREELRGFVLERMENDAFHAANAYSWFGVIDRSLISKHGIAVYYNVPIVGIQGVNGLSTLVLCASADYHRHYHKTMSRRNAVDCLAALASVEVFSEPIPRILLNKELNNVPPFPLWEKMIRGLLPNGLAMIGATFSMLISVEMNDETGETGEPVESGRGEVGPKEILEWVLARNEVKRLKDFSQIQQSMSRPRFLS